jgi:hypothetical protein
MRQRRWWSLGLGFLAIILLCEVAARAVLDDPESPDFVFDAFHLDARLRADAIRRQGGLEGEGGWISINAQGFRGTAPFVKTRIPDVGRIAVAGTGHAFGENLTDEQTWPERLEQALGRENGHPVEVYNFGRPGATVVYLDRFLLDEMLSYTPDVVVLAYGGFNEALLSDKEEEQTLDPAADVRNALRGVSLFRNGERLVWKIQRKLRGDDRAPKVSVETFISLLGRAVERIEAAGARAVLVQETVIHPDIPGVWELERMDAYRSAVVALGEDHSVPVFDPDTVIPAAERQSYFWRDLLYDARIAEALATGVAGLIRSQEGR